MWHHHRPAMPTTVGYVVIKSYQSIITDRRVAHNKPDITIWDKATLKALIVGVAVPMDRNVLLKISEKLNNYCDLELEVKKCWYL